jgi:photosystem II stability/assembly factor-like uncharacterized protein
VLWRTTDAGRTWRPIARPDRINFSSVTVRSHVMALRSYDDANFVSRDGGKTWRLGTVGPRRLRATIGKRFYADETCGSTSPFVEAGRVLRVTYDGGVTWRVVNTPIAPASVAVGADLVVVVGLQDCSAALAVSRDGGKRWSVSRLAHACEPSVAPAGGDVWLACDRLLLQSDDFGRSWLRLRVAIPIASIAPTGQGEAWIVAGNGASIDDKNRLWRATDRGKTWHQVWPALPTRG